MESSLFFVVVAQLVANQFSEINLGSMKLLLGSTKSCCSSVGLVVSSLEPIVVKLCFFDFILSVNFFPLLTFFIPAPCSQKRLLWFGCLFLSRKILKCFGSSSSNSKQRLEGSCGCGNFNATAANKSPVGPDTSLLEPYSVSPT